MTAEAKEQVYDTQITPLMAQIIEICKTHGIAIIASYDFGGEEGRRCTTCLPDHNGVNGVGHTDALRYLYSGRPQLLTLRTVDAGGHVTVEAIAPI